MVRFAERGWKQSNRIDRSWPGWLTDQATLDSVSTADTNGRLTLASLPTRLLNEIRFVLHHQGDGGRTQWRPPYLQRIADLIAAASISTLASPDLSALTKHHRRGASERRILLSLPIAARAMAVTKEMAKDAGWFDHVVVGAGSFPTGQGHGTRRKSWHLQVKLTTLAVGPGLGLLAPEERENRHHAMIDALTDMIASAQGPVRWVGCGPMAELAALLTAAPEYAEQLIVTQMGGWLDHYRDLERASHNFHTDMSSAGLALRILPRPRLVLSEHTNHPAIRVTENWTLIDAVNADSAPAWRDGCPRISTAGSLSRTAPGCTTH